MWETIKTLWPYLMFYFRNRARIDELIAEAKSIKKKFDDENPEVPSEWKPTEGDVVEAMVEEQRGNADFTPKTVSNWTMPEWETYWRQGSGTGEF